MSKRLLTDVIDAMVKEIPETEVDLRDELARIHSSCVFSAPENMIVFWERARDALVAYIGEPKLDWQIRVAKIFVGEADA